MKGTFYNNKNKFMNRAQLYILSDRMTVFTYIFNYYIKKTLYNMYSLFVLIYNITPINFCLSEIQDFFYRGKTQFKEIFLFTISNPCRGV